MRLVSVFQSITELSVNIYEFQYQITFWKYVVVSTLIMNCVYIIIFSRHLLVSLPSPCGCTVIGSSQPDLQEGYSHLSFYTSLKRGRLDCLRSLIEVQECLSRTLLQNFFRFRIDENVRRVY